MPCKLKRQKGKETAEMDTIGKIISEYRRKKELKQDELAEALGVSP